ncbi:DNA/RNA helicase, ATP-dependent, DEAH-box type, conserved site-containing protein [Artemisia annua]|uniref:DNA/RNA helicase, ATP-dependent, DEAH-box type, conserved site-containing protein n=1 Tax=Artemisia annua TaxID=35608 RepID=A0A2U1QE46_ARTAN|nr:DNA/RNA helicase, ATP-dependent, DEAH-box type, conserved site-containing protein [Artemisia annua]
MSESNEDCLKELEYYLCKKLANSHRFPVRTLFSFVHASFPPKHKSKFEKNNGSRNANESKLSCSSLKIGGGEDRYDGRIGLVPAEGRSRLDGDHGVELYKVYRGFVTRVMDKYCCVQLHDFKDIEGIVHVSQMSRREVVNANEITGRDLLPLKKSGDDESLRTNPFSGRSNNAWSMTRIGPSGIRIADDEDVGVSSRTKLKRINSPERWEAKQLKASGVLGVKGHPVYHDETEEGVELNEDEPAFLQGKTKYSMDMSPILKNPEGSLSSARALQAALLEERKEIEGQRQRTMIDYIPKHFNRP